MFCLKKLSKKAGMVLTEALVAVSTMAMGVVALGSITTNSISTTILSRDYLVAGGLLNEADEAVININYTNWLLKPADKATCWLRLEPDNSIGGDPDCGENAKQGGNYIVVLENGIWKMETDVGGELALENAENKYINDQFKVYLDAGGQGYFSSTIPPGDTEITESKFFRSINFLEKDDTKANYMTKIQWLDGAQIREIKKTTTLYNYQ